MINRVCFVIPSLEAGGAERVVSLLANHYVTKKIKVSIVLLKNKIFFPIDENVDVLYPKFAIKRSIATLGRVIHYYRKAMKHLQPDVIISFLEFYNEILLLSLRGTKNKIYISDRSSPFKKRSLIAGMLRKLSYPTADGLIVQTSVAASLAKKKKLGKNILILPNPVSNMDVPWRSEGEKCITTIGRLVEQKNQKYLIKIFSEVPNDGWRLQIVGDGELREELEKYAKELQVDNKVCFLGEQKDIKSILSSSTIFALPSLWEGFPNALLEAMAMGVPCISNNCVTGPSELIEDGKNGFLVSVDDEDEFKNKLVCLMADRKKRECFSAKNSEMRAIYSVHNISDKLLEFVSQS